MKNRVAAVLARHKANASALLAGFGLVSAGAASAQATAPDVSTVVATIAAVTVAAGTIGVAYLSMTAGVKLYKWIKQAM